MMRYDGRRVLVTGAGSGIGQATVVRMLSEGARVVAADISESGLADTVATTDAQARDRLTTIVMNIAEEESVRSGVAEAVSRLGGLDALVNAAGILRSSHTATTTLADFEQVLRVNLIGTFLVIREAIGALIEGEDAAVV
ncbi:MAG: SDR family oxidoreductase, partial [Nocardioidaceae bacterium]|nr:SDR family oxidoreductase [Nocardioidaceae bacterium]